MKSSLIPMLFGLLLLAAEACTRSSANSSSEVVKRPPVASSSNGKGSPSSADLPAGNANRPPAASSNRETGIQFSAIPPVENSNFTAEANVKREACRVRTFLVQSGDGLPHKAVFDHNYDGNGARILNSRTFPGWPYFDFGGEYVTDHIRVEDLVQMVTWPAGDTVLTVKLNEDGKAISFNSASFLGFSNVAGAVAYNNDGRVARCFYAHRKNGRTVMDTITFRYDTWGNISEIEHAKGAELLRTEFEYDYGAPLSSALFLPQQVDENYLVLQYLQHAGYLDLSPRHAVKSTLVRRRKGAPVKLKYSQFKFGRMWEVISYRYDHGVCHQWYTFKPSESEVNIHAIFQAAVCNNGKL